MKKWEYTIENKSFGSQTEEEEWLRLMDDSGWELVAVASIPSISGIVLGNHYYFRKEAHEEKTH